jgi:hypothetical protein
LCPIASVAFEDDERPNRHTAAICFGAARDPGC